ncbi:helix-turn-helix domain-containing protein [Evansella cellulosilytica]|uniref:Helix-turn-helix domain protein n=1 Tax=Evansella cellulosilytica (strain ATCC 21833 / DSM 2522 / FERM P-1141 / JCM 9156 / N-4) TaxID=649639 RepID=E6U1L0_EVAC2|nr:helix-turn-helix transcriptional regulator [Evansella cellulosilytica]ADU30373.1 helix-turn-helix domain protein [Evansella cellulosilytica DSM 2522]
MRVLIKLDKILNERDMSQHELSRLTGIRQPSVNEMCRNQTQRLPLDNLAKICEVLECDISDVLELKRD